MSALSTWHFYEDISYPQRRPGARRAGGALPGLAQPQIEGAEQINQVRRDSRIHLGPLYASPTILLKELGVDSNVFNAAGEQQSDFTFTVGPKVDVWLPVARRALFQGTAATDLVYYATHDSERSVNPQFSASGEIYLRRITLFGEGQLPRFPHRLNSEVDLRRTPRPANSTAGLGLRSRRGSSMEAAAGSTTPRSMPTSPFDGVGRRSAR